MFTEANTKQTEKGKETIHMLLLSGVRLPSLPSAGLRSQLRAPQEGTGYSQILPHPYHARRPESCTADTKASSELIFVSFRSRTA